MAGETSSDGLHAPSNGNHSGLEGPFMPLAEAPEPWLQLLVNNDELLDMQSLQSWMSTNWAICRAVLRCMQRWRLGVPVRDLM